MIKIFKTQRDVPFDFIGKAVVLSNPLIVLRFKNHGPNTKCTNLACIEFENGNIQNQ